MLQSDIKVPSSRQSVISAPHSYQCLSVNDSSFSFKPQQIASKSIAAKSAVNPSTLISLSINSCLFVPRIYLTLILVSFMWTGRPPHTWSARPWCWVEPSNTTVHLSINHAPPASAIKSFCLSDQIILPQIANQVETFSPFPLHYNWLWRGRSNTPRLKSSHHIVLLHSNIHFINAKSQELS